VNFPSLLAHFKCETCAITRGARTYRTSKRVQEKGYHTKQKQDSEDILDILRHSHAVIGVLSLGMRHSHAVIGARLHLRLCHSPLEFPDCDPSEGGLQDISRQATCLARASQPKKKKRRKSKQAKGAVIAASVEAAVPNMAAVAPPRLMHPPQHRMHIDYAHSIILGRNKELYYLIIVIDSIDFMWPQPSPNRSESEDLIPKSVSNDSQDLQVMVTKANSIKDTWYVECDIVSPKELRESTPIQLHCLWYEERPPLQIIKITCRIFSATSSTAL